MIRALDPKLNPATAEIQALRNQLADRDKQILNLEVNLHFDAFLCFLFATQTQVMFVCFFFFPLQRQCEQARLREYEEKLIVTAWYNKVKLHFPLI